jgi:hypothetical protein
VHSKTRAPEWAKIQSQWRWAHAYVCYLGPPSFILWRIRWPLLFNLAFAAMAALDAQVGWFGGLAAKLSDDVLSAWHMLSFVLALLLVRGARGGAWNGRGRGSDGRRRLWAPRRLEGGWSSGQQPSGAP